MIKVADYYVKTERIIINEGTYRRWTNRFNTSQLIAPYTSVEKIGRIFVYLMRDDHPIAYFKGNASDFSEPNAKIKWVEMVPDPSVDKISEPHMAGVVAFKLSIVKRA